MRRVAKQVVHGINRTSHSNYPTLRLNYTRSFRRGEADGTSYLLQVPITECVGKEITYGTRNFTMPKLSDEGYVIRPKEPHPAHQQFIADNQQIISEQIKVISEPFDVKYLERDDINPIGIKPYKIDEQSFSRRVKNEPLDYLRVLDMCVSVRGSNEYYFPKELDQFRDVLQQMIDIEHTVNSANATNYWAYVTVDQMTVEPNNTQRRRGCHIDGMEGPRIKPKVLPGHSYLICDKLPPVFYTHGFSTLTKDIDVETDNIYDYFDDKSREEDTLVANPYEIYMFTAYSVHRSAISSQHTDRTVMRLYYAMRQFDRLGNTYNPCLPDKDYKSWVMSCRVWKDDAVDGDGSALKLKDLTTGR